MELLLTTAHAASSYGVPVLVIDGQVYGPADTVPGTGGTAIELLLKLAQRFLDAAPSYYGLIGEQASAPIPERRSGACEFDPGRLQELIFQTGSCGGWGSQSEWGYWIHPRGDDFAPLVRRYLADCGFARTMTLEGGWAYNAEGHYKPFVWRSGNVTSRRRSKPGDKQPGGDG